MIYSEIMKEIEDLRKRLHKSIEKNGIGSTKTREISTQLDELINNYYKNENEQSVYSFEYKLAYEKIKQFTREFGEFPSTEGWDKYAKENQYLSHVSIEYLSGLNWNELRGKINSEVKKEKSQE